MHDTNIHAKETLAETIIDGRYRLIREIARGGVGTVFEAEHSFTRRRVALKLLNAGQANAPEAQARLLREAQALTLARHHNVVEVLDAGFARSGQVYLVTEFIDGRSLDGLLAARGKLPHDETVHLGLQLVAALTAVHRRHMVHRDVKPHNILLRTGPDGRMVVKLVDFGAALVEKVDVKLTQAGQVLGTPEYMSPEQLMGETVDQRSDVYSLGITLYECLTGDVPFSGNFGQVLLAASTGRYRPVREHAPDVPEHLAKVIEIAIAIKPDDRFQSMDHLAEALTGHTGVSAARPAPLARRAFKRASYVAPVRVLLEAAPPCDGRTEDISEGGVLLFVERDIPVGQRVRLRFAAPMTGLVVEVGATAKWAREQRGRRVAGLEFIDPPADALESIRRYVELMAGPETP